MGVLPAVLPDAGEVALDVARVVRGAIERRREQPDEAGGFIHEVALHRLEREPGPLGRGGARGGRPPPASGGRARSAGAAPERTAHAWASASIRHSSLSLDPSGAPSS